MNVFVKPDEQSQACLSSAMARKRAMKWNVFVKPDEQSQACLSFAMARKRAMKWNTKSPLELSAHLTYYFDNCLGAYPNGARELEIYIMDLVYELMENE